MCPFGPGIGDDQDRQKRSYLLREHNIRDCNMTFLVHFVYRNAHISYGIV
jgi:hypothetical protein